MSASYWQCLHDGEARLLAAEFSLLSTLHQLAWDSTLWQNPPTARREVAVDPPRLRHRHSSGPGRLQHGFLSASRSAPTVSLIGCPYRFFARYVLGLGEMDEVSEEMDKREYGEFVHRSKFSATRHPQIAALAPETALAALQDCVETVFAPAIRETRHRLAAALGKTSRRLPRLAAPAGSAGLALDAGGNHRGQLPLQHGGSLELYGRIDRIDRHGGGDSLLDYKTAPQRDQKRLPDDIQPGLLRADARHSHRDRLSRAWTTRPSPPCSPATALTPWPTLPRHRVSARERPVQRPAPGHPARPRRGKPLPLLRNERPVPPEYLG